MIDRRRLARTVAGIVLAPICALVVAAILTPLPPELRGLPVASKSEGPSIRVLDRDGRLVRQLRAGDGALSERVTLSELPPEVPLAVLAAEDARFYRHPGIDPFSIARAIGQDLYHRRIVSGASTITQQLARTLVDRPRSLRGKFREMAIALRVEASVGKAKILEEYLSRVEFGRNVRGIEAASRLYFDKPASKLSLGEAATLAAIPRGPALYDPRRGTALVERRRNRILERMRSQGFASSEAVEHALAQPIVLQSHTAEGGARHFVNAVVSGALAPELANSAPEELATTLDSNLQREVETLVHDTADRVRAYDASAAAAIVIENSTGDILAYVGSPDFFDARALGQNDGVLALRQPGSALKPFVYGAAMDRLGMTPATIVPDVELHLPTPDGDYSPKNYDGRYHGPVRLREALGSSLNVPAVYVAHELGPAKVLDQLHAVGFASLDQRPEHYGAAIALGDGEVTLAELGAAYSTLARGGGYRPLRAVRSARLSGRGEIVLPVAAETQVLSSETTSLLADILSDPYARASAFGRDSVLDLPFPVAVKTGTSKGFRDNWTAGYTREVTVAVWVGNFDGHSMVGSSGITGAGPLFHDVMLAAMRGRTPAPLVDTRDLEEVEVCSLSGKLAGPRCTHRVKEHFGRGSSVRDTCDVHIEVAIDPRNGLLAGEKCAASELHAFETYPGRFTAWAVGAGRPLAPTEWSPLCPGKRMTTNNAGSLGIAYPFDGARFSFDPALSLTQQAIVLSARAPLGVERVRFVVDGRPVASSRAPFSAEWRLIQGEHQLVVETSDGHRSDPVRFVVD